jgi:hypothetical protein
VLHQAHHPHNHDTAEQSGSHQNIDSYIYQSRPLELNFRKYRDSSHRTWLNSLMFSAGVSVPGGSSRRAAHYAGQLGSARERGRASAGPVYQGLCNYISGRGR